MIKHPDQRLAVFIDVSNMYHSAKNLFNRKLNFKEVLTNPDITVSCSKENNDLEEKDYFRFIHDLYEFNDTNVTLHTNRRLEIRETGRGSTSTSKRQRDLLIDIIAFCLMPNHFHLVLRQLKENGITRFMQKFGTGYTMYFNQKNQRTGVLFQGRFKAILVDRDSYFLPLLNYIHLNPLELTEPRWKEKGIKNLKQVSEFLNSYRWSSYQDYIGIKNFPSVINKEFLIGYFKNEEGYKNVVSQWPNKDLNKIKQMILED